MKFPFKLLQDRDFDAVGFGTNAVDYLIRVPEYPAFNSKVELDEYVRAPGGEVASAMVGLRRLGMKTAYAGRFGGDPEGEYGLRSLVEEGVDTTFAERIDDARTQIAFILIDGRNGERTIVWNRDEKLAYTEADAPTAVATRATVLHLTPHDPRACVRLARVARGVGVIVSLDIDNVFDGVDELLPLVDIFVASADFPEKLLGIKDEHKALREIGSRFGCPVIGLTRGASGSILMSKGSIIETGAFDVPGGCIDTTGAGDAFRAGFLYGLLKHESVEDAARIANAVAALKCRSLGARDGLPAKKELTMFLKKI
jgi:sugar/nucleoside kinase (ribokinase family)